MIRSVLPRLSLGRDLAPSASGPLEVHALAWVEEYPPDSRAGWTSCSVSASPGSGPPNGLEDVSKMPNLIAALLKRGYSDAQIKKIFGENYLRVIRQVTGR